ncbi:MAG: hypothetical protein DRG78_00415 [Epsilonproteobacteria bacterium]|nr:MAG: hypothetical protein DRG78_00415 [Campylobacterota bacterium]
MIDTGQLYYLMMTKTRYDISNYKDALFSVVKNNVPIDNTNSVPYITILRSEVEGIEDLEFDFQRIVLSQQTETVLQELKLRFS